MQKIEPEIHPGWKSILMEEFNKDYFHKLKRFLVDEKKKFRIFPPGQKIFEAFNRTPLEKVKVVLLGQDPYHGQGQAHGLCFSVPEGVIKPPSLENIFKEMQSDLGTTIPDHGNLEKWANQGVFLLNATLTVRANQAGSHQNKGWEEFTDAVISKISELKENVVYLLWGRYARNKETLINSSKNYILKAAHPSPFSAYNGFFGCKHFSKTNEFLKSKGIETIDWQI